MSFVVIDCSRKECDFTFVHKNKTPTKVPGDFGKIDAFVRDRLERNGEKIFVFQGLSDVVVVRDDSDKARKSYECQRKVVDCICTFCCLFYFFPCFSLCLKYESPNTLYSSIAGETFLFRERSFLFDINRFTGNVRDVERLLIQERDEDSNISKDRRSALNNAFRVNGAFSRFVELLGIAKKHPSAIFLIDSGSRIEGLTQRVQSYTSIHFEGNSNPMKR